MVALLKQKSKVKIAERERKVYDVAAVFKPLARKDGGTPYTDTKETAQSDQIKFGSRVGGKLKPEILGKQDEQM